MDVHAENIEVALLVGDSNVVRRSSLPNAPQAVARAVKQWSKQGEIVACYEAGVCGFELYRQLEKLGVRCDVVAPSLIPKKPGDRIKTDRRDAEKLARLLRSGELTAVHVPTDEQEAGRDLLRAREDAREHRTGARNQLTKFLLRHGHRFSGCNWTRPFWSWLGGVKMVHESSQLALVHYIEEVEHLDARIKVLDEETLKLSQSEPYRVRVARLSCFRGISTLTSMVILTELFDLRRFASPRQLMAYLGLVTSEYSSGGATRRGGITKTGNANVRRVLVEAAWSYSRKPRIAKRQRESLAHQPPPVVALAERATLRLGKRFARLASRGKPHPVALIAVARELAGFVWAMENQPVAA
jgi:transposase